MNSQPESPLQFAKFRRRRLSLRQHLLHNIEDLVGVGHIALIQGEVIFQERFAEALHPHKLSILFRGIGHG